MLLAIAQSTDFRLHSILTLISQGGPKRSLPPPGILVTFPKIYLELIFLTFFQNSNCFLQCQHFFTTRCYFLCMSSVEIINIYLNY